MIVVSDTSPLIALAAVGQLRLLPHLYGQVIVPEQVFLEATAARPTAPGADEVRSVKWIRIEKPTNQSLLKALTLELDHGEAAAICLALQKRADLLLIDERRGRKAASRLGCRVVGVMGLLVEAKRQGLLSDVRSTIDALATHAGFRISSDLRDRILAAADE